MSMVDKIKRVLILLIVFVSLIGCEQNTQQNKPERITKKIIAKFHETYTENSLDPFALAGGKFRSVPVIKNRYRLWAEDGTYVDVDAKLFVTTKEGDYIESSDWDFSD